MKPLKYWQVFDMPSIRENPPLPVRAAPPPDYCNLGIWLRVLLGVNAMAFAAALARNKEMPRLLGEFAELAAFVEPTCLATLVVLCAGRRWLAHLPPALAAPLVVGVAALAGVLFAVLLAPIVDASDSLIWRAPIWSMLAAIVLLAWFHLSARARAPALSEARLMALTARIRPHFLFNSLNAVLGVIRSDPRQAERALESLADLFRALMRDNRDLVPLSTEIALAREYLDLERLRLGDRLQVRWDVESCPPDALVPPLMLQPLLENAIYHGVEPLERPGPIAFRLLSAGRMLVIELSNPQATRAPQAQGNRMALANIRERLEIYYGLAAYLNAEVQDGRHTVRIVVPYQKATQ